MNSSNPQLENSQVIEIAGAAKWEVYHRLQGMQIPCQCGVHQLLQVQVYSPLVAIQLWSVVRQVTAHRYELVRCLEHCWQMDSKIKD